MITSYDTKATPMKLSKYDCMTSTLQGGFDIRKSNDEEIWSSRSPQNGDRSAN